MITPKPIPLRLVAAIDIGTTAVRMLLAEVHHTHEWRTLEDVSQSIPLGKDVHAMRRILPDTAAALVSALRQFKRLLSEYAPPEHVHIHVIATSAFREAENREAVTERIFLATGLQVNLASSVDITRMMYMGLSIPLRQHAYLKKGELLSVELGGGMTEFLGFDNGNIRFAKTTRLGLSRLSEQLSESHFVKNSVVSFLTDQISSSLDSLNTMKYRLKSPKILVMGGEARFIARALTLPLSTEGIVALELSKLRELSKKLFSMTPEQIAVEFHIPYHDAETTVIAVLGYILLAEMFNQRKIFISNVTLRDGMIAEILGGVHWNEEFCSQVLASAIDIGEKYFWSRQHAETVANYATSIFTALRHEHGLSRQHKLILEVAALLHDIGAFISARNHHIHSMYLIQNSDLFGLNEQHIQMIALIARYHRKASPIFDDPEFSALIPSERIVLLKLAGILRVADALDRSHDTRLGKKLRFSIRNNYFEIYPSRSITDVSVEAYSLKAKGALFADVFGLQPLICPNHG